MTIKLLILDVDGVLTGGGITLSPEGEDVKTFHVQDGFAIKRWQRAGGQVAILSGRRSPTVEVRAQELGIEQVHTGVANKLTVYEEIVATAGVARSLVCVVGDDIPDIELMGRAGLSIAVANALPAVKRAADYVTRREGGDGAVAEVVEHLLRNGGRWPSE
jgi:3-deoxy-D-manno-octulosonate 8-phosphate phosphatase (KDO 8-P phosphatase)